MVLVNGLFMDLSSFDQAAFYLKNKFQLLRYDCRGQGLSPKPNIVYSLNDHVEDLQNLLESLDLKNFILIGLSNGGRIVLEHARRYKTASAVVACDTYDIPSPLLKAKLKSWLLAHEESGPLHRFDVATPWIWGEEVFSEKSELILSYRDKAGLTLDHVVKNLILGALETDIDISEIDCPVLLVAGEEDLLTPVFYHQAMLLKLQKGELAIVKSGHASLLERPTIMDKTILPWLIKQVGK
ncbi:MAG: alpha/beta hydrolase [Bacteriovorax sp.]|nr:alpha/beta hydrolase [Bacteriovorax sp.]